MGTILENRSLDWITAPGDEYTLCNCPPPPDCSKSDYISSLWLVTTGTITVEEVASPGGMMMSTGPTGQESGVPEEDLIKKWVFQHIRSDLGPAVKVAEQELQMEFKLEDLTLTATAVQVMLRTFKIRADWVVAGAPPCCPPASAK